MNKMTCHQGLQHELLAAQSLGSEPGYLVQIAIKWLGLHCAGSKDLLACLERSPRCEPGLLLPELLAISGQDPGLLGLLAWRCLACNLVTGEELLALPSAAELLAGALLGLHTAMMRQPEAVYPSNDTAPTDAARAFSALAKLLATSAHTEHAWRIATQASLVLRASWGAAAAASNGAGEALAAAPAGDLAQGPQLLARLVGVVHREVFPRELATRWLESELSAVLQAAAGPPLAAVSTAAATQAAASHWRDAMAAFAAALPLQTLFSRVQQALRVRGGEAGSAEHLAEPAPILAHRCGQLLAAAAAASPAAAAAVEGWGRAQAAAAMQARDAPLVQALLLLQRQLCSSDQDYRACLRSCLLGEHAAGQQQQQAGGSDDAGQAAGPGAGTAQFLLQAVLIPMLPDEDDAEMLEAQLGSLEGLDLPFNASHLVQEYRSGVQQRLRSLAKHAAQEEQALRGQAISFPSSATAAAAGGHGGSKYEQACDLASGQQQVGVLLREFQLQGGKLAPATLADLRSRYENVFQRGAVTRQLLAALLQPPPAQAGAGASSSGGGAGLTGIEERAALMQYLHSALHPRLTELRAAFTPQAVAHFRQRCLLAQLGGASLAGLSASLAEVARGALGVSAHQVLDRMGELVGRQVRAAAAEAGGDQGGALQGAAAAKLASVLEHLLNALNTAYTSCLGQGPAPSTAGVACHLVGIIHAHEELHGLLLQRVEQLVLEAGPAGQLGPQQALSLAMLAASMGALLTPLPHHQQQPPEALFSWKPGAGAGTELVGALWLQRLLQRLPLRGVVCMSWACRFSAALLSCLRHFPCFARLEPPGPFSGPAWELLVAGQGSSGTAAATEGGGRLQAARVTLARGNWVSPGQEQSYDGEWLGRLAYPLCLHTIHVLQWMQLRLGVAGLLAGRGSTEKLAGQLQVLEDEGEKRGSKRQRLQQEQEQQPGANAGHGSGQGVAGEVLALCQAVLGGDLGASLAGEAGPLRLSTFLRLEAAAVSAASQDLIRPLLKDSVLRAVCVEYFRASLQPPPSCPTDVPTSSTSALSLPPQQPLLPVPASGVGPGLGQQGQQQQQEQQHPVLAHGVASQETQEFVPDSPGEEEMDGGGGEGWAPAGNAAPPPAAAGVGCRGAGMAVLGTEGGPGGGLDIKLAIAVGREAALAALYLSAASGAGQGAPSSFPSSSQDSTPGADSLGVVQAACTHLLRMALRHTAARSARAPARNGDCDNDSGGGEGGVLVRFLLALVRGCQQGLPTSVAAAAASASCGRSRGAGGAGNGAGSLGKVLAFDPLPLQRVAQLAGALARGLSGELLLPPPESAPGVPVVLEGICSRWQALAAAVERSIENASLTDADVLAVLSAALLQPPSS